MVKISIELPNHTRIGVEAANPDELKPLLDLVRQELLSELSRLDAPHTGVGQNRVPHYIPSNIPDNQPTPPPEAVIVSPVPETIQAGRPTPREDPTPLTKVLEAREMPFAPAIPPALTDPRLAVDFTAFCRAADPMGDMRKVVVAAEGAKRHLGMASVDAWELGHLFDIAGWTRPHSFAQTLRNAARQKFRWLEKVPGRQGRYTATEEGLSTVLG